MLLIVRVVSFVTPTDSVPWLVSTFACPLVSSSFAATETAPARSEPATSAPAILVTRRRRSWSLIAIVFLLPPHVRRVHSVSPVVPQPVQHIPDCVPDN